MAGLASSIAHRLQPEDIVAQQTQEERSDIWTTLPGKVVSVSGDGKSATIQPLYKPRHNGKPVDMPQLVDVPVEHLRAGGFGVSMPIKPGDEGKITFHARNLDNWYGNGEASEAATARMHDLSDATFQPGLSHSSSPFEAFDPDNLVIGSTDGQTKLEMSPDGKFRIVSSTGEDLFAILKDFMTVMMTHTNEGATHDQAGAVGAIIARLEKVML